MKEREVYWALAVWMAISIQELDENLAELTASFEKATSAKLKCQREAESTALTISLANRLVGGLASEKVRWGESVKTMKKDEQTLGMPNTHSYNAPLLLFLTSLHAAGDVLVTSAYLSYVGCFSRNYRQILINEKWLPYLKTLDVCYAEVN